MTRLLSTGSRFRSLLALLLAIPLALGMAACLPPKQQASTPPPTQTESVTPPAPPTSIKGYLVARFVDVGQGDAIFISLPDGTSMLIDAGPKAATESIVSYMNGLGTKKLDYVIFTPPHEDHIGGAVTVLKAFDVGQIYMPKTSDTTDTYKSLLLAIQAKGLIVTEAKAGTVIVDKENLKASLIGPGRSYPELNDSSPVVVLKYGTKVVFAGDAGTTAEGDMLATKVVPDAYVLKVGHHGSSTSTGQAFLEVLTPSVAVISVGPGNKFGYPTQAALDRLSAAGTKVYRTDMDGMVTVTTDGKTLSVGTACRVAEMMKRLETATPAQVVELYYGALGKQVWDVALAARSEERLRQYGVEDLLRGMRPITRICTQERLRRPPSSNAASSWPYGVGPGSWRTG